MTFRNAAQELDPNQGGDAQKKTYHKQPTGKALETATAHSAEKDLKLYGSCFCPFVHRVWISLEFKKLDYEYCEVDVYRKPDLLLDINPRGLVPALRHGDWGCYESTVLMVSSSRQNASLISNVSPELKPTKVTSSRTVGFKTCRDIQRYLLTFYLRLWQEYLEDIAPAAALLPKDAKLRAHSRLWADHINRHIIPGFYKYLQAQEPQDQVKFAGELKDHISKIVDVAASDGPFFLGPSMSFVDIQFAPWIVRMSKVLKPYRGWPEPIPGSRWANWVQAIESSEPVRNTTSTDELYLGKHLTTRR